MPASGSTEQATVEKTHLTRGCELNPISRAPDLPHVGEGHRPVGVRDGQQPLVELVLDLRQRQLVGVVMERVFDVARRLHAMVNGLPITSLCNDMHWQTLTPDTAGMTARPKLQNAMSHMNTGVVFNCLCLLVMRASDHVLALSTVYRCTSIPPRGCKQQSQSMHE